MNIKWVAAAIVVTGLVACSPDVTPERSSAPGAPATSSTPARPIEAQQPAQPDKAAAAPAADEAKKDEGAAPAVESGKEEGEKKAE